MGRASGMNMNADRTKQRNREREAVRVRDVQDSVRFGVLHLGRFDGLDLMFQI